VARGKTSASRLPPGHNRRTDEGEKKDAYLTIPALCVYLLVEQESPTVVLHRRSEQGFVREVHEGLDAVISLDEIGTVLPLAEVYDGAEFAPQTPEVPRLRAGERP
jgi:Uma2 family endonuclease